MELLGLQQCLEGLQSKQVAVHSITTDRHMSIEKWLRECTTMHHFFDTWHISKGQIYIHGKCDASERPILCTER